MYFMYRKLKDHWVFSFFLIVGFTLSNAVPGYTYVPNPDRWYYAIAIIISSYFGLVITRCSGDC
ncbi:hypothetical protein [Alkalihalobacillus sp. LMS39]|uniref:hypothetical protein n=1 Tax=Alkalihalobacillus sp. LMS39 TaxID=2924032 RepID=UPI001FB4D9E2|nr:hypothetical protein [Alkalihalobacillus sp. LMS39]UOE93106.1 hypothetical protein MM271_18095 [Alkalihalobacillus sp. LMS39]